MKPVLYYIEKFGGEYLVMDGRVPLMSGASLRDELRLYNLGDRAQAEVIRCFSEMTGKTADGALCLETLSGGQKVILATLIALESDAKNLMFINFFHALYPERRRKIMALVETCRSCKQKIEIIEPDTFS